MGVFRQKPPKSRRVVPRSQVIIAGLRVEVFAGVAEGVRVRRHGRKFHAEGVIGVSFGYAAAGIGYAHHVSVGVVQVISIISRYNREAIAVGVGIIFDKIVAIPNVYVCSNNRTRRSVAPGLRPAQAARVVAVSIADVPGGIAYELILRVVGISRADRAVRPLRERVRKCSSCRPWS